MYIELNWKFVFWDKIQTKSLFMYFFLSLYLRGKEKGKSTKKERENTRING